MNRPVDLSKVAGKNIEDLTIDELKAIASKAGRKAYENAIKRGSRVTKLRDDGQLVWVYPDGHTEPLKKTKHKKLV
jgi:superfamily II RNA helicase